MKLNYKKTILVGFAFFLICAFWQAYDSIVPMMLVNKFGLSQSLSGVIMSIDNVIAVFLLPLFGSLSDRTKTKFGRRTPYIVLGTVVAVVAFFGLTFADNSQLAKLEAQNGSSFYEQVFDGNYEIVNAEYNSFTNKDVNEKFKVKDYASKIVKNKSWDALSEIEQHEVKSWYKSINEEYLKDHSSPETVYYYKDGVYSVVEIEDGKYYYISNGERVEIKKTDTKNAFTNLITPAISGYAWQKTISNPTSLILFICLLLVTLLAMATFRSPAVALMPDVTVKPLRSQANAIINLLGTAGGMLVLVLGIVFGTGKTYNQLMSYTWFVGAVCLIMVAGLITFILTVKEPAWAKKMQEDTKLLGIEDDGKDEEEKQSGDRKLSKGEFRSLILLLSSVALWFIAYNAVTSKYSLYATNVLHKDYNTTLLLAQAAAIVAYIPVGALAKKIGRKKSILTGIVMLTVAFGGAIFMNANSSVVLLNVLFVLAGVGWATINVNSFPMVVELASGSNVGKYTGYYYTASMSAQILTPILSGVLMDIVGNMRPLFYYSTIFAALAFVTMFFVKHGDSKKISVEQKTCENTEEKPCDSKE